MTPALEALNAQIRARYHRKLTRKWASWPAVAANPRADAWDEGYAIGMKAGTGKGYAEEGFSDENPYRPEVTS